MGGDVLLPLCVLQEESESWLSHLSIHRRQSVFLFSGPNLTFSLAGSEVSKIRDFVAQFLKELNFQPGVVVVGWLSGGAGLESERPGH